MDSNNTKTTNIPFNVSAVQLRSILASSWDCPSINVEQAANTHPEFGSLFIVEWYGCPGSKPTIGTNSLSTLSGGTIQTSEVRDGSNNILFDPVTSENMRVAETLPQLTLRVNGVLAVCATNCSYVTFDPQLYIMNYTFYESESILRFQSRDTMANPIIPDLSIFEFKVHDVFGFGAVGTYLDFNMTVRTNNANTTDLEHGSYLARSYFGSRNITRLDDNIRPFVVTMGIIGIVPASPPASGGIAATIQGRGFARPENISGVSVTYCNKVLAAESSTTGEIVIFLPPCNNATTSVSVTYRNVTASLNNITLDSVIAKPVVTSVSPASISPLYGGKITITGSGFEPNTDIRRVVLTDMTTGKHIKYLRNISDVSATEIVYAIEPDTPAGQYYVTVINTMTAGSNDNVTLRVETTVTDVTR